MSNEKYVEASTSLNLCFTLGYFPISLSWNMISYNSPHQFKDCLFNCVSFIISVIHCVFTSITTNFNILFSFLFCSFETEFYSVARASLKLILLLQPPNTSIIAMHLQVLLNCRFKILLRPAWATKINSASKSQRGKIPLGHFQIHLLFSIISKLLDTECNYSIVNVSAIDFLHKAPSPRFSRCKFFY